MIKKLPSYKICRFYITILGDDDGTIDDVQYQSHPYQSALFQRLSVYYDSLLGYLYNFKVTEYSFDFGDDRLKNKIDKSKRYGDSLPPITETEAEHDPDDDR